MIENFVGGHGQKWVLPSWWQDSKIYLSEEWTDGINLFFACWYKSRKLKVDSVMLVVLGQNGQGFLVYEILKSFISWEWMYKLSCFLNADSDAIAFG